MIRDTRLEDIFQSMLGGGGGAQWTVMDVVRQEGATVYVRPPAASAMEPIPMLATTGLKAEPGDLALVLMMATAHYVVGTLPNPDDEPVQYLTTDGTAFAPLDHEHSGQNGNPDSMRLGAGSSVVDRGTAIGVGAQAADASTAVGRTALATGYIATALGWSATASGQGSFAQGYLAEAREIESIAIGWGAKAHGHRSIAIGSGAVATQHDWAVIRGIRLHVEPPFGGGSMLQLHAWDGTVIAMSLEPDRRISLWTDGSRQTAMLGDSPSTIWQNNRKVSGSTAVNFRIAPGNVHSSIAGIGAGTQFHDSGWRWTSDEQWGYCMVPALGWGWIQATRIINI